jgi:serine/threonine protein kinase/Flp pilus assembly protein TadD
MSQPPSPPPRPDDHPEAGFLSARSLKRGLLAELEASRESERPLRPEDLLVRWPSNPHSDPDVASLLFADYQQRHSRGESLRPEAYEARYPEHKDSLARLFRQHEVMRSLGGSASAAEIRLVLPSVGDEVFGFVLRHELGAGAFARVFLAEQASLAGRPVVLKTSDLSGDEPQTLAQLQHTHIVPIHSVHEDAAAGLRAVCMPYFGGASFSAVLKAVWETTGPVGGETPPNPRRGEELVEALKQVQAPTLEEVKGYHVISPSRAASRNAPEPPAAPGVRGRSAPDAAEGRRPLDVLRRLSYPRAVAWVIARLAEGLHHAHQRGVLHRDIKPSNVLLGADGQPMLLDFNLAQCQREGAEAVLGGTVAYMAPEHLRALNARTPALAQQVDHRSDIYSLGMVLFEALTGHNAFDQSGSYSPVPVLIEAMAVERSRAIPSVKQRRSDVPWGLESIVRKCLAPNPAGRYQQAEHLAEDLRRFLDDRPLKHAPELSWAERAQKWVRRHPRLSSSGSVALAALALLGLVAAAFAGVRGRLHAAREQLAESESQERVRAYEAGAVRALLLVNANTDLRDHTRQGRAVCEETLGLYGVLDRPDWQERPEWLRLTEDERRRLGDDTRELLLLLAWARTRVAPGDKGVLREALALLDRAETVAGLAHSPALWLDRASYLRQLGDEAGAAAAVAQAGRLRPANARDHYLLATAYARSAGKDGRARAIAELNRCIELNPRYYWAWFQRGVCHQSAGDHLLAAADFGACVGLWPEFAWAHFNLGCAHDRAGLKEEAVRSYTAALARDAVFVDAYLNRGMALLALGRTVDALADFTRAADLRPSDAALHAGRGMALEALGRSRESDDAFAAAFARLGSAPAAIQDRVRCGYAFSVSGRLPDRAKLAFDEVLARQPRHAEALYGRACVAAARGRPEEAVRFLERTLAAEPGQGFGGETPPTLMMEARRHLAIQLARCGRFAEAFAAVNLCLEREPRSGPSLYAAACVAARAAERAGGSDAGRASAAKALSLLREAFARGYGRDKVALDPDLAALRGEPAFAQLTATPDQPKQKGAGP